MYITYTYSTLHLFTLNLVHAQLGSRFCSIVNLAPFHGPLTLTEVWGVTWPCVVMNCALYSLSLPLSSSLLTEGWSRCPQLLISESIVLLFCRSGSRGLLLLFHGPLCSAVFPVTCSWPPQYCQHCIIFRVDWLLDTLVLQACLLRARQHFYAGLQYRHIYSKHVQ